MMDLAGRVSADIDHSATTAAFDDDGVFHARALLLLRRLLRVAVSRRLGGDFNVLPAPEHTVRVRSPGGRDLNEMGIALDGCHDVGAHLCLVALPVETLIAVAFRE